MILSETRLESVPEDWPEQCWQFTLVALETYLENVLELSEEIG